MSRLRNLTVPEQFIWQIFMEKATISLQLKILIVIGPPDQLRHVAAWTCGTGKGHLDVGARLLVC